MPTSPTTMVRTVLFGVRTSLPMPVDLGMTLLRIAGGATMAFAHGYDKLPVSDQFITNVSGLGFPMPAFFAWSAALSEFVGGLMLAVGLATRPAAFFLLTTMAVAFFIVHDGDPFQQRELALLYGAIALTFLFAGSGRFGVDYLLGTPARRPA